MALQRIGGRMTFKKATDIPLGEKEAGYLTGIVESKKYPGKFDLEMCSLTGETYILSTSGTLKYWAADCQAGKFTDKNGISPVGFYVEITRGDDYKNKLGNNTSSFEVACDKDREFSPTSVPNAFMDTTKLDATPF